MATRMKRDTMTAEEFRSRAPKARHKFGAVRTERDGIKFPSRLEARVYDHLTRLQAEGRVVGFIRQPPFDLGGGTKYTADFLVFFPNGTCEVWDAKGHTTPEFIKSKKQVEARYPWVGEIKLIKKV